MAHEITVAAKDAVEFERPVSLRRGECACGWRGCWFSTDAGLARSIRRHEEVK